MRTFFLFSFFLFSYSISWAQNPSKINLQGYARDTADAELSFATVMLLNTNDSTLVNFTRTDEKGFFSFKNIRNLPYLLKITHIGYLPVQLFLPEAKNSLNNLDTIRLKPINQELMEVVIRTAKAPLFIRGDTIEYDASSFKVPPGSSVEDLLRRLPGIEVDLDGNIKAQGEGVRRVYVDGKIFFGDNPKLATRSLGAESVGRVQVYDEKTEQVRLTGIDDGIREKALNLELKEGYKKGAFGKITAGIGDQHRWMSQGNYNRFNQKEQLSFVGFANNINQSGLNWEDYSEFKGQQSFTGSSDLDFGFASQEMSFSETGSGFFLGRSENRGFTRIFGAGTNYNFFDKKNQLNLSYFYNELSSLVDQYYFRETFLDEGSVSNTDTSNQTYYSGSHSINTRWELKMDSNNTLLITIKSSWRNSLGHSLQVQEFNKNNEEITNRLSSDNDNASINFGLTSTILFRHRFRKKERVVAGSAGANFIPSNGTDNLFSFNQYFIDGEFEDTVRMRNERDDATLQYKSSLLYSDQLSKKLFWETFYNFYYAQNEFNRQVKSPSDGFSRIDSLSVFNDNDLYFNRLGTSLRFANKGLNCSISAAIQRIDLAGKYLSDRMGSEIGEPINRKFVNIVPNFQLNYQMTRNKRLNVFYNYNISRPTFSNLQPVPVVSNRAFQSTGNPNLSPAIRHSTGISFFSFNPGNFLNYNVNLQSSFFESRIVNNTVAVFVDSIGFVSISKPENVTGGKQMSVSSGIGFPIVKTKLTCNVTGSINYDQTPGYVNGIKNNTENKGFRLRLSFNINPNRRFSTSLEASGGNTNLSYSIQKDQNQQILDFSGGSSLKWQFAEKTFFESNFNYSKYQNDRFAFSRDVPIWNTSIRQLLFPGNKIEIRLAVFDLLNRKISVNQSGSLNYVYRSLSPTLSRYFLLSVAYNVKGFEVKLKN